MYGFWGEVFRARSFRRMENFANPLTLKFKFAVIHPQFSVTDANGRVVAYVKQKAFKLKEDITVFSSEAMTEPLSGRYKVLRWSRYRLRIL